jgi:hypothetical protein
MAAVRCRMAYDKKLAGEVREILGKSNQEKK